MKIAQEDVELLSPLAVHEIALWIHEKHLTSFPDRNYTCHAS